MSQVQVWSSRVQPQLDAKLSTAFKLFAHIGFKYQFIRAALDNGERAFNVGCYIHILDFVSEDQ
jgi:hypothetical protein